MRRIDQKRMAPWVRKMQRDRRDPTLGAVLWTLGRERDRHAVGDRPCAQACSPAQQHWQKQHIRLDERRPVTVDSDVPSGDKHWQANDAANEW
jgi:hypothetical protein